MELFSFEFEVLLLDVELLDVELFEVELLEVELFDVEDFPKMKKLVGFFLFCFGFSEEKRGGKEEKEEERKRVWRGEGGGEEKGRVEEIGWGL